MLLQIGLGDVHGVVEGRSDPIAEPGLEAGAEEEHGEDRDDDRRQDGDDREEGHEPAVQLGAGQPLAALQHQLDQPAGDDDAEQEEEDEVDVSRRTTVCTLRPEGGAVEIRT